jgi:hypothetical protein
MNWTVSSISQIDRTTQVTSPARPESRQGIRFFVFSEIEVDLNQRAVNVTDFCGYLEAKYESCSVGSRYRENESPA